MMNLYPEVCSVLDKNRMLFLQLESRPNSSFHRLGISLWIFTYFFLPLWFLPGRRPAIHGHENYVAGQTVSATIAFIHSFIHSFIRPFHSAPSSPLPLRGAPDYSTDTVSEFHAEAHRQLQVKDLPKVPTWRLERESNPRPSG